MDGPDSVSLWEVVWEIVWDITTRSQKREKSSSLSIHFSAWLLSQERNRVSCEDQGRIIFSIQDSFPIHHHTVMEQKLVDESDKSI